MHHLTRSVTLAAVSVAALISAQGGAQAGAFALREQSATAQGLSFAGAASGSGGLSSMYWNPATITMAPGFQGEFHASAIIPETKITPTFTVPAGLAALGPSGDIGLEGLSARGLRELSGERPSLARPLYAVRRSALPRSRGRSGPASSTRAQRRSSPSRRCRPSATRSMTGCPWVRACASSISRCATSRRSDRPLPTHPRSLPAPASKATMSASAIRWARR